MPHHLHDYCKITKVVHISLFQQMSINKCFRRVVFVATGKKKSINLYFIVVFFYRIIQLVFVFFRFEKTLVDNGLCTCLVMYILFESN
jgi:hypothetical protein